MRLSDLLRGKPERVVTLPPTASVAHAAALMKTEGVGAILICDDRRRVLGVLSERELAMAIANVGQDLFGLRAGELMAVDVPTAAPDDSVQSTMRVMTEQRARHLPVLDGGRVVGIVSIGDIVKSRLAEKIQENAVLQDIVRARLPA
jgi:CBS domain-containing protein